LELWAAGTDPALNAGALLLILRKAEDWAEIGIETLKRAKRIGGRGRTEDLLAKWMRGTAEFVYEGLTTRKANIAYDAYAARQAESRARKRQSMAKK